MKSQQKYYERVNDAYRTIAMTGFTDRGQFQSLYEANKARVEKLRFKYDLVQASAW